jgi:predicted nucleic acid-binding protein
LEANLKRYLIQPYTRGLGQQWAEVMVNAQRMGRPIGVADAWIAATALHFNVPLVTHNAADFAGVNGLIVITEAT